MAHKIFHTKPCVFTGNLLAFKMQQKKKKSGLKSVSKAVDKINVLTPQYSTIFIISSFVVMGSLFKHFFIRQQTVSNRPIR